MSLKGQGFEVLQHHTSEPKQVAGPSPSLVSLAIITETEIKTAEDFATKFGIAFQIKDDLINVIGTDSSKPSMSDINNKIYTAPILLLNENIEQFSEKELIEKVQTEEIKDKTIELIKKYATKAIASLDCIKDNQYKQELINLCENLYKVI